MLSQVTPLQLQSHDKCRRCLSLIVSTEKILPRSPRLSQAELTATLRSSQVRMKQTATVLVCPLKCKPTELLCFIFFNFALFSLFRHMDFFFSSLLVISSRSFYVRRSSCKHTVCVRTHGACVLFILPLNTVNPHARSLCCVYATA